jgi:precorrin-6B C5,15-methyltransferase / cobalt-precorrin-6B C5,C15-methyltransferase
MATQQKIAVIGIGDDGIDALSQAMRARILDAEVILGPDRALRMLPAKSAAQRIAMSSDLEELARQIAAAQDKKTVILVFGDPMFYGLARYVGDRVGRDRFDVMPHVSSMQLAFARVMESWDEAYLTNLASHPLDAVVEKIRTSQRVGLFTSDTCGPPDVAKALLDKHIDYFTAYVCENLGARDETVTRGTLAEIARQKFGPLNVMVLVREADAPDRPREAVGRRVFGNPDEAFLQSQPKHGLLTPAEVRAMALAQLDIASGSIVWDVGAGSGSVSIEAAQLASDGTVYAIEMDAEDHGLIRQNAERFRVSNVIPVLGKAPEAWSGLPDPDCIFIAGSGREVTRIAEAAFARLRAGGRLVVNLTALEDVGDLQRTLRTRSTDVSVWMVNIARGTEQLQRLTFEALKPNFLVAARKG